MFAARATGPRESSGFLLAVAEISFASIPRCNGSISGNKPAQAQISSMTRWKCITHRITICMPADHLAGKAVKRCSSSDQSSCRDVTASPTSRCAGLCRGLSPHVGLLDGLHPHRQWTARCMLGLTDRP
ncbi:hypothetical protein CONLIGDRAFT_498326 [Coniochaeta ligniaria NRRL 30616]|uniref:Uncharacterized protein n=1 Tax=Coniochaeta ligniaria NRRL 30616 TaxID=1408157 RepID=A0A1J7IE62_9PEZI|nr:hypothetical protein CONLIGDRAFT_498326 [Coniochaeta ligniaria NRRL 30616]